MYYYVLIHYIMLFNKIFCLIIGRTVLALLFNIFVSNIFSYLILIILNKNNYVYYTKKSILFLFLFLNKQISSRFKLKQFSSLALSIIMYLCIVPFYLIIFVRNQIEPFCFSSIKKKIITIHTICYFNNNKLVCLQISTFSNFIFFIFCNYF